MRHGASARAGKASSTSSKAKKGAARSAPARASRTASSKTTSRAAAPAKAKKRAAAVVKLQPRNSLGFPVLPVSILVAIVLLGWFMYPILKMQYAEQRKLARLETQLAQIQKRNQKLKREVDRLKTPQGIETAAHELGLARKGEQVWVTVTSTAPPEPSTGTPVAVRKAEMAPGVWTQVLDTVFGFGE